MNKEKTIKRPATRHPAVWWSRIKFRWPFLVWVGAIVLAAVLFLRSGDTAALTGVVEVVREDVAPIETARLETLYVEEGQEVRAGDLLAEFDTSMLKAEMAVYQLQVDRQFEQAIADAQAALQDAERQYAEDTAELQVLNVEMERLDDLLESRLIDAQSVVRIRTRQQALTRAVEQYPSTIQSLREQLKLAKARSESVLTLLGDADAVGGAQAAVSREQLGLLRMRYNSYALRASKDGTISRIFKQPGEVVAAGESTMTLVASGENRIVGFLPEWDAHNVIEGDKGYVKSANSGSRRVRATVSILGPDIMALPGRVSPIRGQPIRGRRIIMIPDERHGYIPGETVSIFLHRSWFSSFRDRYVQRDAPPPDGGS